MASTSHLTYNRPDVAKWGGVTGCFEAAQIITQARRTYCPHFRGGGIVHLSDAPGFAVEALTDSLSEFETLALEATD